MEGGALPGVGVQVSEGSSGPRRWPWAPGLPRVHPQGTEACALLSAEGVVCAQCLLNVLQEALSPGTHMGAFRGLDLQILKHKEQGSTGRAPCPRALGGAGGLMTQGGVVTCPSTQTLHAIQTEELHVKCVLLPGARHCYRPIRLDPSNIPTNPVYAFSFKKSLMLC